MVSRYSCALRALSHTVACGPAQYRVLAPIPSSSRLVCRCRPL